jgi:hypothetical protein
MSGELRFDADRDLIIPADQLGPLAQAGQTDLRLLRLVDDVLICGQPQPGGRKLPLLYGDLRLFHVAELMALISSMRRDGTLSLMVPHAKKAITFAEGEVVFATSNVEDDRLGEVLWRRGFLTLEQLGQVHDLVGPGVKLGRVLIDHGMLTPRKLYDGLREQVLEIVFSAFHFQRGEFLFIEEPPRQKGNVRLELTTRDVVREGVRRVQEMTRLEELLPDPKAILTLRPVKVDVPLEERERHLLGLIDGQRSVAQVLEASHLGEFEAAKALARLLSVGLADARARTRVQQREVGELPDVLAVYARLIRRIHQTLVIEGPECIDRLEAFLAVPSRRHREVFRSVALDAHGRLDVDTLYRNARRIDAGRARALALESLRAFYDYALFQAMDVLDEKTCEQLVVRLDQDRAGLDGQSPPG